MRLEKVGLGQTAMFTGRIFGLRLILGAPPSGIGSDHNAQVTVQCDTGLIIPCTAALELRPPGGLPIPSRHWSTVKVVNSSPGDVYFALADTPTEELPPPVPLALQATMQGWDGINGVPSVPRLAPQGQGLGNLQVVPVRGSDGTQFGSGVFAGTPVQLFVPCDNNGNQQPADGLGAAGPWVVTGNVTMTGGVVVNNLAKDATLLATGAIAGNATTFLTAVNVSAYREILCNIIISGLAGGATPKIAAAIDGADSAGHAYDRWTPTSGAALTSEYSTQSLSMSGAAAQFSVSAGAGTASTHGKGAGRIWYAKAGAIVTGGPTTATGTINLYGFT